MMASKRIGRRISRRIGRRTSARAATATARCVTIATTPNPSTAGGHNPTGASNVTSATATTSATVVAVVSAVSVVEFALQLVVRSCGVISAVFVVVVTTVGPFESFHAFPLWPIVVWWDHQLFIIRQKNRVRPVGHLCLNLGTNLRARLWHAQLIPNRTTIVFGELFVLCSEQVVRDADVYEAA